MHIPKKDIVKFFVKETLLHQNAYSQKELADMINRKLKPAEYSVSAKRVRSIALEIPGIRLKVDTKKGRMPAEICPVCTGQLKKIYNKNLIGQKLLLMIRCERCGYTGKEDHWAPKKYGFEYRRTL
jgi:hypothetical protein